MELVRTLGVYCLLSATVFHKSIQGQTTVEDLLQTSTIAPLTQTTSLPPQCKSNYTFAVDFLPYGPSSGDNEAVGETNLIGPLELEVPLVLYTRHISNLYIKANGVISSKEKLSDLGRLDGLPSDSDPLVPLIVPMWANFRPLTINYRVTQDPETLQQVASMITGRNPDLSDYQPSIAVVVTVVEAQVEFTDVSVTFQTVLSSDGNASFAAFLYNDLCAIAKIHALYKNSLLIGFDAGDEVRAVEFVGPGSALDHLEEMNIFRIDGNCVTGIGSDEVCGLNSMSTGCSTNNGLATMECLCNSGVNNSDNCQVSVELTCPKGSDVLPMCSDTYPVCLLSKRFCDRISDCDEAADEVPSLCGNLTFLPYGSGVKDSQSDITEFESRCLDCSEVPIMFYRKEEVTVYAVPNGLISFAHHILSPRVQGFPRTAYPVVPAMASVWTEFFEQSQGILFSRITYDPLELSWVKKMIVKQNPQLGDYKPKVAVVVTWHNFVLPNGRSITHQGIVSSDGNVSFATFVYGDDGVKAINDLQNVKLIGFDAGDSIKGATVLSPGFSSQQTLQPVNTFRIDGHCVTTAYPGEVCGLNSYAVSCDRNSLSATACRCYQDMDPVSVSDVMSPNDPDTTDNDTRSLDQPSSNTEEDTCQANATFTCEEGSVPSICPGEGDDSPFLGCFPNSLFCNFASDCPGGIDEMNCTNHASPFLEFGEGAGDTIFLNPCGGVDDINTPPIILDIPIMFYEEAQTKIFVSSNGFISYGQPNNRLTYLPIPYPIITPVPIMAPLWVDLEFITSGAIYSRVTHEPDTLYRVVKMITDLNPALSDYQPTQAVIVTWFKPRLHALTSGAYGPKVIGTFQAIVSTDGTVTFAVFVYEDELEVIDRIPFYQVGFASGEDHSFLNIVGREPASYTGELKKISAFRVDGACVTSVLPGEVCGLNAVATECPETSLMTTNCTCIDDGFEYNGTTCVDINECATLTESELPCHEDAYCNNTAGSFECVCNEGYTGDGSSFCARIPIMIPTSTVVGVVVFVVVAVLLTIVVISISFLIYRKHVKHRELAVLARTESQENDYHDGLRKCSVRSALSPNVSKSLLVNSCNLQLGKTIGQGEFGIVYRALLRKSFTEGYSDTVAVKTLKGFLNSDRVDDLLKECTKMQEFDHPNILNVIGVCLDGGPAPYIIMPFMTNGSLLSHLKENRDSLVMEPKTSTHEESDVVELQKKLLDMCFQVAKGMEYLASKRLVHRDLAARNCMIDSSFVIKVADFGLSESIGTDKDYFRQSQDDAIKLPINWLSIESINDGIFSEKTDVWAYGVTCWEVFSGGKTPYPGIHPLKLCRHLETGHRMDKPLNTACSAQIHSIMSSCWEKDAELRPLFSELVGQLSALMSNMADYFDLSTTRAMGDGKPNSLTASDTDSDILRGDGDGIVHRREEPVGGASTKDEDLAAQFNGGYYITPKRDSVENLFS